MNGWEAVVVGSGQDAGVPQVGCSCPRCTAARSDPSLRRLAPSLLLMNEASEQTVLIDVSPDVREQLDRHLAPLGLGALKAAFISHGHIGHYWGLALLGKEGPDFRNVMVYATTDTVDMLRATPAIGLMEKRGNVRMRPMELRDGEDGGGDPVAFGGLSIEAFPVPHRQELTRTVGFRITGPNRSLVYIPDIDRWTLEAIAAIKSADLALIDGTFFSEEELGGLRTMQEIPHPPMRKTIEALGDLGDRVPASVYFTHLNHTNPAGLGGPERDLILRAGLGIAFDGMRLTL